ncbi:MAG TPA: 4-hydroxythreonine-4-phosphate dehydrogenase PdxA [Steroidobacteraceae bacterium]|nr:4-hydroxythreonine-4-phosphate dehydrogenase PdxA [Steroidobacteraceae bacterium]
MQPARIVLTSGEPAGIGPELCLAVARRSFPCELVCLADRELLASRAAHLGWPVRLHPYDPHASRPHQPDTLSVLHHPLAVTSVPGRLDKRNSRYVLSLLDRAVDGVVRGEFAAMTTAPVHKGIINDAGIPFTGHTEYLAERTHAIRPVMLLAADSLRVALATTHLPLKEVSAAITVESLCAITEILAADLGKWWGIKSPRIGVCGLNPHAGEGGYLGDEEIRVIAPAIKQLRDRGIQVSGPLPADTAFVPGVLAGLDAVLAMYHDQGLPVIKHAGFDKTVNVTLGLPILRTSVDHGTALDLAGTGRADPGSLAAALGLATEIIARSR